jgi:hypothetical protein
MWKTWKSSKITKGVGIKVTYSIYSQVNGHRPWFDAAHPAADLPAADLPAADR